MSGENEKIFVMMVVRVVSAEYEGQVRHCWKQKDGDIT
jgi:hypothetical protein